MLGFFVWEFHRRELRRPAVRETIALEELAATVRAASDASLPLTYVDDSPFAIQLALNSMRPLVSADEAAALLRGEDAAFVVTARRPKLTRALGADAASVHVVASAGETAAPYLVVMSNRPALAAYPRMATRVGPLVVTLSGVGLGPTWDNVLDLQSAGAPGNVVITNVSEASQDVQVRVDGRGRARRRLAPGESWELAVP
jgi:hypothetical protein